MKHIDWEAIEREYRAGQLSIREIARHYGGKESAIRMRAKRNGWQRDLADKVRQRVRAQTVRSDVRTSNASDEEIVEEAAKRGSEVVAIHRRDICQGRELVETMFGELRTQCADPERTSDQVDEMVTHDGMDVRAANAARRAVSLPGRASTMRDLSQSLQRLITLERQAFNLDEDGGDEPGGLASALKRAHKRAQQVERDGEETSES